jgi:hypothetical protein
MTVQHDLFGSILAKNDGIQRATDHAEAVSPGWNEQCYQLLLKFLSNHAGPFMAEDFRAYCALLDFDLPPSARAFGGVIVRARIAGIIEKVGYRNVRNVKAHATPATLWQATKK